jgi:hypothetical protein
VSLPELVVFNHRRRALRGGGRGISNRRWVEWLLGKCWPLGAAAKVGGIIDLRFLGGRDLLGHDLGIWWSTSLQ